MPAVVPETAPNSWQQVFHYDAWGNLHKVEMPRGSGWGLDLTANPKNRFTEIGYDAPGDTTNDGSLDYTNRAHLEETQARIRQALEAQLQRGL